MSIYQGVGFALVVMGSLGIGLWKTGQMKERISRLERLCHLLRETERILSATRSPLPQLFSSLSKQQRFSNWNFLEEMSLGWKAGESFPFAWNRAVLRTLPKGSMEAERMLSVSDYLGKAELERTTASLSEDATFLEELLAQARAEYAEKKKLYPSVALLGGLAFVLLLV